MSKTLCLLAAAAGGALTAAPAASALPRERYEQAATRHVVQDRLGFAIDPSKPLFRYGTPGAYCGSVEHKGSTRTLRWRTCAGYQPVLADQGSSDPRRWLDSGMEHIDWRYYKVYYRTTTRRFSFHIASSWRGQRLVDPAPEDW